MSFALSSRVLHVHARSLPSLSPSRPRKPPSIACLHKPSLIKNAAPNQVTSEYHLSFMPFFETISPSNWWVLFFSRSWLHLKALARIIRDCSDKTGLQKSALAIQVGAFLATTTVLPLSDPRLPRTIALANLSKGLMGLSLFIWSWKICYSLSSLRLRWPEWTTRKISLGFWYSSGLWPLGTSSSCRWVIWIVLVNNCLIQPSSSLIPFAISYVREMAANHYELAEAKVVQEEPVWDVFAVHVRLHFLPRVSSFHVYHINSDYNLAELILVLVRKYFSLTSMARARSVSLGHLVQPFCYIIRSMVKWNWFRS